MTNLLLLVSLLQLLHSVTVVESFLLTPPHQQHQIYYCPFVVVLGVVGDSGDNGYGVKNRRRRSCQLLNNNNGDNIHYLTPRSRRRRRPSSSPISLGMISSGFSFSDGEQVLVSVQKPLGIVLEQDSNNDNMIVVTDVDPNGSAARAGVQVGDVLVAVQNASVENNVDLDSVLQFIGNGPRVINLRFIRRK